jgi:hypothetical protein
MTRKKLYQTVSDLKERYKNLSDYEALKIAVEIQRNEVIAAGLYVSEDDTHPSGLEAIAISLGYDGFTQSSVRSALSDIAEAIQNGNID